MAKQLHPTPGSSPPRRGPPSDSPAKQLSTLIFDEIKREEKSEKDSLAGSRPASPKRSSFVTPRSGGLGLGDKSFSSYKLARKTKSQPMIAAKIASWDEDDQGRHVLTAATVQQIVEVFALETQQLETINHLILAHDQFISSDNLFKVLVAHFRATRDETERARLLRVLKKWLDMSWPLFSNPIKGLGASLKSFQDHLFSIDSPLAPFLQQAMAARVLKQTEDDMMADSAEPPAILKQTKSKRGDIGLLLYEPEEIARQLCLTEHQSICKIMPQDLLRHRSATSKLPSYYYCMRHNEELKVWLASLILSAEKLKTRAKILAHLIRVGSYLLIMRNYNTLSTIRGALLLPAIARLKLTWRKLSPKTLVLWGKVKDSLSPTDDFANYRSDIFTLDKPTVPVISILLRDTQLVDASEVSFVDSRINLRKLAAIGEILDRFRRSQNMIYNFKTFDELKSYLSEEHNSFSVERLLEISEEMEPTPPNSSASPTWGQTDPRKLNTVKLKDWQYDQGAEYIVENHDEIHIRSKIFRTISEAQKEAEKAEFADRLDKVSTTSLKSRPGGSGSLVRAGRGVDSGDQSDGSPNSSDSSDEALNIQIEIIQRRLSKGNNSPEENERLGKGSDGITRKKRKVSMDREEEKEPAGRHTPNRDGSSSRNTSTATNTNNNSPTNSSPHGHSKSSKKSSSQTPTSGKKSSRSSPLGKSSPPSSRRSRRSTMSRAQEKETTVKEAIKEKPIETLNSDSAPSEPEPTKVIGNVVTNVGHQSHGATRAPALGNIGASFADSSSGLVPAAEDGYIAKASVSDGDDAERVETSSQLPKESSLQNKNRHVLAQTIPPMAKSPSFLDSSSVADNIIVAPLNVPLNRSVMPASRPGLVDSSSVGDTLAIVADNPKVQHQPQPSPQSTKNALSQTVVPVKPEHGLMESSSVVDTVFISTAKSDSRPTMIDSMPLSPTISVVSEPKPRSSSRASVAELQPPAKPVKESSRSSKEREQPPQQLWIANKPKESSRSSKETAPEPLRRKDSTGVRLDPPKSPTKHDSAKFSSLSDPYKTRSSRNSRGEKAMIEALVPGPSRGSKESSRSSRDKNTIVSPKRGAGALSVADSIALAAARPQVSETDLADSSTSDDFTPVSLREEYNALMRTTHQQLLQLQLQEPHPQPHPLAASHPAEADPVPMTPPKLINGTGGFLQTSQSWKKESDSASPAFFASFIIASNGEILQANSGLLSRLKLSEHQLVGQPVSMICPELRLIPASLIFATLSKLSTLTLQGRDGLPFIGVLVPLPNGAFRWRQNTVNISSVL